MMLIGVDYHPSFQQIAFFVEETGDCGERQLNHREGEAERFYRDPQQRGIRMRVGMEATGYSRWFERLLVTYRSKRRLGRTEADRKITSEPRSSMQRSTKQTRPLSGVNEEERSKKSLTEPTLLEMSDKR